SMIINPRWSSKHIAPWWGKSIIFITMSRVEIKGIENIDKKQSYIIVCNHQSTYDTLTIYGYLPLEFKWIMKKELERIPFVGIACKTLGHIFVDRSNSEKAKQSLIAAKSKISDGVSAFFFPEGTRSPTGELINFKKGAFHMAQTLALPILPITITGANKVMPANSLMICPHKITLTIHPAISAKVVKELSTNELSNRAKTTIASSLG
ncbi:MAG TPA: 1-acyl-sn-glycerol-3-phosphate acyltransferase, partial [Oceanospirillales bacterium]|nr:1-acyl-sn-glycerol-3-phosphate acyltransferase [Oceanospirillales bacterium]